MVKLSREPSNPEKAATAMACDVRTSFKNTFNVAAQIRGMGLAEARKYSIFFPVCMSFLPFLLNGQSVSSLYYGA